MNDFVDPLSIVFPGHDATLEAKARAGESMPDPYAVKDEAEVIRLRRPRPLMKSVNRKS